MTRDNPSTSVFVLLVVFTAIVARLIAIGLDRGGFSDPDNYLPLAHSLAAGDGFLINGRATAYRPPLYPLLLAPFVAIEGDRPVIGLTILHAAFGAGTSWLTILAARRFGASDRRALVAGLIVSLDPVLVWQARSVMTETPTALLLAGSLAFVGRSDRWSATGAGVLLGLAGLCRPSVLPGAALAAFAAVVVAPGDRFARFQRGGLLALGVAVVLAPWGVRNRIALGEFVWTTTHGGYTLALANNEIYYREILDGPAGRVWTGPEQALWWQAVNQRAAGMPEPAADRLLRDEVLVLARRDPATFLRACYARLTTFWSPTPSADVYGRFPRLVTTLWTIPLWAALALGLVAVPFRRWPGVLVPCLILGLTIVHLFYWTDLRMRAPITPAIATIAVFALLRDRPRARESGS